MCHRYIVSGVRRGVNPRRDQIDLVVTDLQLLQRDPQQLSRQHLQHLDMQQLRRSQLPRAREQRRLSSRGSRESGSLNGEGAEDPGVHRYGGAGVAVGGVSTAERKEAAAEEQEEEENSEYYSELGKQRIPPGVCDLKQLVYGALSY
jgi:hypothetical protein